MTKKLLTVQYPWFYLFYLGFFNALLVISFGLYVINWSLGTWQMVFDTCCPRKIPFLVGTELFPVLPSMGYVLLVLQIFAGICCLEVAVLTWKSKQVDGFKQKWMLVLGWSMRVFLRNISGLLFFLSLLATPQASAFYVNLGMLSLFFIYWGQQGHWNGYSLNASPESGLPKQII